MLGNICQHGRIIIKTQRSELFSHVEPVTSALHVLQTLVAL